MALCLWDAESPSQKRMSFGPSVCHGTVKIFWKALERKAVLVEVEDGYTAIILLKQGQKFDLITLDYHMPGMDGVAVARWIRTQPGLSELPILMITTDTSKVYEAVEIGITEFLGKPFDRESLAMTLNRMMDMSLE